VPALPSDIGWPSHPAALSILKSPVSVAKWWESMTEYSLFGLVSVKTCLISISPHLIGNYPCPSPCPRPFIDMQTATELPLTKILISGVPSYPLDTDLCTLLANHHVVC
jgi:hypothetical protein